MTLPERFAALPDYAFPRLRRLLEGIEPGGPVTRMSIGEPQHPFPDFVPEILAREAAGYSRYPPIEGTPALREAIAGWLARRYGVADGRSDDWSDRILPLNGTREGLYTTCIALCPERKNGARPAVLMPNPFYQAYAAAALAAQAEPVYLPATEKTGHLPDFASLPAALLDRTAIAYVCSPANPQGAVASSAYWQALLDLAERHDFTVFADECYSEIWRDTPPPGALEATADPERLVVFNSLSKRSSLPGLRSGFLATGPKNAAAIRRLRSYSGAPLPLPVQAASAAAWADEAHVVANRTLYQEKLDAADRILGPVAGYFPPEGGFFVWLRTGDGRGNMTGETAARLLWQRAGVLALPGAYLSRPTEPPAGKGGPVDPGADYVRLALVAPLEEVRRGLEAVRDVLGRG